MAAACWTHAPWVRERKRATGVQESRPAFCRIASRSASRVYGRAQGVYRRLVPRDARGLPRGLFLLALPLTAACTTVDPGANFVVPNETFDPDFFYCHVEPTVIFGKSCGSGDPGQGDPANGCHFNSSAVSGMALVQHPAIDCGGGDHPVDRTQVGPGSPAEGNLQATSLEMSRDYQTAPFFVRPTGHNHPRTVFTPSDANIVDVIQQWSQK
jgi:hypothetical protein